MVHEVRRVTAPLRRIAVAVLAAVLSSVLWLRTTDPAPTSTPSITPPASLDPASEEVLSSAIEGLTVIAQRFDVHSKPDRNAVATGSTADPNSAPKVREACSWWPGAKHNTGGLTGIFLFGHVAADRLWRHPLLNPGDRAPCPPECAELDELLLQIGHHLDAAADRCSAVKLEEMVAIARTGVISPYEPEPVPDASLRIQARITAESRRELGLEADEQVILDGLRRAGIRRPSGVSHVSVDGKFYLASSFQSLPRSEVTFEAVRMCAAQAALAVMGFFVAHGYCTWDARMDSVLEQILTRPLCESRPVEASGSQRGSGSANGK